MSDPKITGQEETVAAPSLAAPSREAAVSTPHQVLGGRYEILGLLGTGGMGSVYRARDTELDEVVALKMLRKELVDAPGMLARFRQEVKLARRVTHRNVARTFDIGEHLGEKFLTMEFIDGEPLSALLAREGALPLERVVALALAICAGLSAAHAAGVVHRDLKPDNVLLAKDGRVVINDFGIARAALDVVGQAGAANTMGVPLGTPAYMAPEQVQGSSAIDARADVYALGAMLYELLTGMRPWTGDSVYAVAAARLTEPPPDPRFVRADVPSAAAELIMKCMARAPADRFATIDDVAAVLSGLTMPAASARAPAMPQGLTVRSEIQPKSPHSARVAKSLAVLPFRNAGAPDDEYLADALTEDLIDALSMASGLRVRSRGVVMKHKGAEDDPRAIGRELDVQVVVEGSVRRAGANVRVSVRLVSVEDGFQLWAKRFERPASDVLAMGDEAADAIAQALTVHRAAPQRDAPTDPIALDLYMRARHEYHKFWRDGIERSLVLFKDALARAPDDPMILSGYAMALMRRFAYDESADASAELAVRLADRALEAAPHMGEPYVALASLHFNMGENYRAALRLRDAITIAPNLADAEECFGHVLLEIGHPRQGIARLTKAIALEPRLYPCRWDIARTHALLGEWELCEASFDPKPSVADTMNLFWIARWRVTMWKRDKARAELLLEELRATQPFAIRYAAEAMLTTIVTGVASDMALQELDARSDAGRAERRRAFFRMMKAELLACIGRYDDAMVAIEQAEAASFFDVFWIDRCPLLDPMRATARFTAVHKRIADRAAQIEGTLGLLDREALKGAL